MGESKGGEGMKWVKDGALGKCPKCGKPTETAYKQGEYGEEVEAERCPKCRWIVRFTDDGPKKSTY